VCSTQTCCAQLCPGLCLKNIIEHEPEKDYCLPKVVVTQLFVVTKNKKRRTRRVGVHEIVSKEFLYVPMFFVFRFRESISIESGVIVSQSGIPQTPFFSSPDKSGQPRRMPMNKSVLKKWVRGHVQPYGVKITNLSTSFGDGLAFAALVHQLLSLSLSSLPSSAGGVPSWASLTDDTPLARMAWAFDTAQQQLQTEPLLDAADTVDYQDQRSIMLYLNTMRNAFGRTTGGSSPTLPNPPRASSSSSSFRPKKKKKSGIGMQAYKSRSFSPAGVATAVTLPEEKEEV
jgi:hypothetical protein